MSENKKLTIEEIAEIKYPLEVGYGVFDRNCQISDLQEAYVEGYKLAHEKLYSEEYKWKLTEMLYKLAEGKIGVIDSLEWLQIDI